MSPDSLQASRKSVTGYSKIEVLCHRFTERTASAGNVESSLGDTKMAHDSVNFSNYGPNHHPGRRYLVLNLDFDYRANVNKLEIQESWNPNAKAMWTTLKKHIGEQLELEYGVLNIEQKRKDFDELGIPPRSIISFHNKFMHQARKAFVFGAYYPALVGACALGERILNHLVLKLRDDFKHTP